MGEGRGDEYLPLSHFLSHCRTRFCEPKRKLTNALTRDPVWTSQNRKWNYLWENPSTCKVCNQEVSAIDGYQRCHGCLNMIHHFEQDHPYDLRVEKLRKWLKNHPCLHQKNHLGPKCVLRSVPELKCSRKLRRNVPRMSPGPFRLCAPDCFHTGKSAKHV